MIAADHFRTCSGGYRARSRGQGAGCKLPRGACVSVRLLSGRMRRSIDRSLARRSLVRVGVFNARLTLSASAASAAQAAWMSWGQGKTAGGEGQGVTGVRSRATGIWLLALSWVSAVARCDNGNVCCNLPTDCTVSLTDQRLGDANGGGTGRGRRVGEGEV